MKVVPLPGRLVEPLGRGALRNKTGYVHGTLDAGFWDRLHLQLSQEAGVTMAFTVLRRSWGQR